MRRIWGIATCLALLLVACAREGPSVPAGPSGESTDVPTGVTGEVPATPEVDPTQLPPEVLELWESWEASGPSTYTFAVGTLAEPRGGGDEPCGLGFGLVEVTVVEDAPVRALDLGAACEVDLQAPPEQLPMSVEAIFALVAGRPGATAHDGRGFGFPDYVTFDTDDGFFELYVPSFREGILDERLLEAPAVAYDGELEVGTTYRFLVYLHCGMEWPAAFNGVAWHSDEAPPFSTGGAPPPPEDWPLVDQSVHALVTLQDADTLALEVVGPGETVTYTPAPEGQTAPGCA